jgi:hypothetical protein
VHPQEDPKVFLEDFIARNWAAPYYSGPLYASSVRHKVRAEAVRGIFESMVDLSDHGDLMNKFLGLPIPRMFMYGEQKHAHLSAAGDSQRGRTCRNPFSGHFPM